MYRVEVFALGWVEIGRTFCRFRALLRCNQLAQQSACTHRVMGPDGVELFTVGLKGL